MKHDKIEKNVGLLGVLTAVAISFGGLAEIVPLYFSGQVTEPAPGDRVPVNEWAKMRLEVAPLLQTLGVDRFAHLFRTRRTNSALCFFRRQARLLEIQSLGQ